MRWLRLLVLLSLAELAGAQTTTYTGVIKDLTNSVVTSGQVQFTLTPPSDSAILGTARFVPTTVTCLINGSGQVTGNPSGSCIVASNTALVPTGTAYRICIQPQFITPGSCFFDYAVTSSKDISTVLPTLGTGLVNYRGPVGPAGPAGSTGPTGPAGPIASVFGRTTSAITAANGDYTCSQVTNAVCTPLNLYYQTVQVAAVSSTPRPRLNFISGTNIAVGCVDNSGNNSTDCTIATSGAIPGSQSDVTGSRSFGATYQNTSGYIINVSGYGTTTGSSVTQVTCSAGPSSPSLAVFSIDYGATVSSGHSGFTCDVPNGYFYSVTTTGATTGLGKWVETIFH